MKPARLCDLRFEPKEALERFKRFGRALLAVPKSEVLKETRKGKAPPKGRLKS